MNDLTLLREAGPEAPPLSPAARSAARAALLAEIEGGQPRSVRLPSRKVRWRIGVGAVAVAASWAAAVVIAAPDAVGPPPDSVRLVNFDMPTFPLSLDPAPAGLRPAFDGDGDGAGIASYDDAAMENGFTVHVGVDEPEGTGPDDGAPGYELLAVDEVPLGDDEVEAVTYAREWCVEDTATGCVTERRRFTWLSWERRDDQWVSLLGHGDYADAEQLQEVAGSLVDRPQPATLDVGLAPEGWSIRAYKMGRVLTLVNDAYEAQDLTVHIPPAEDVIPADQVRESIMGPIGPQLDVTVNGRPAQLVRVDIGYVIDGHRYEGWYLQAQFPDGTTFVLQAPEAFTQEQVLEMAEQVTYTP
ncbi:hypothetical protein GCU60_03655 [Blastococcus saxobsidens]|uniref:Uncharacterized protein n=1 Tax=Blastococcus saxobsidens TaxID=138336 RepID=A0A6L9VZU1_9ACTN|nr:hypothetical protein [Blastococcus saxobsidens]NEK84864.1 hypothetical protein [Blastococcus saxobsidens]